jgi:hypothetical protein
MIFGSKDTSKDGIMKEEADEQLKTKYLHTKNHHKL